MVKRELLLKVVPPLLQEMEGAGYPYATQANTLVESAVTAALSDMITISEASVVIKVRLSHFRTVINFWGVVVI